MGILKNRQKCPSAFRHSRHTGIWRNNISCNPGCHAYHFSYGGNPCIAHISVFACCPSTHHPNIFETMFCIPLDCINPLFYNFHINVPYAGAFSTFVTRIFVPCRNRISDSCPKLVCFEIPSQLRPAPLPNAEIGSIYMPFVRFTPTHVGDIAVVSLVLGTLPGCVGMSEE